MKTIARYASAVALASMLFLPAAASAAPACCGSGCSAQCVTCCEKGNCGKSCCAKDCCTEACSDGCKKCCGN
ncbi:hypothetical protein D3C83_108930 [compost metagenome]